MFKTPLLRNSLLVGDFNIRHPSWDPRGKDVAKPLIDWIKDNGFILRNKIGVGTFYRLHLNAESVLDLAFTRGSLSRNDLNWRTINVGSDHLAISLDIEGISSTKVNIGNRKVVLDTKAANWDLFNAALESRAEAINYQTTSDIIAEQFTEVITDAVDLAIPKKTVDARSKP